MLNLRSKIRDNRELKVDMNKVIKQDNISDKTIRKTGDNYDFRKQIL